MSGSNCRLFTENQIAEAAEKHLGMIVDDTSDANTVLSEVVSDESIFGDDQIEAFLDQLIEPYC